MTFGKELADAWAGLAARSEGFVCTHAAIETQKVVGGVIMGYTEEENPESSLAKGCGGHDFLLVEDHWIVDFWAAAYIGEMAIHDLCSAADAKEILRLYGPREKWKVVDSKPKNIRDSSTTRRIHWQTVRFARKTCS